MLSLCLRLANLDKLPDIIMPCGYKVRTYQPGDEAAWGRIMDTGIEAGWTVFSSRPIRVNRSARHVHGVRLRKRNARVTCTWFASYRNIVANA